MEKRGHVLAIPYPSQGHINPMHQLCKRLVSKGLKATLAITTFISNSINPDPSGPVSIETISDGFDNGGFAQADSISGYIASLKSAGAKTSADIIIRQKDTETPITCIVYDAFLPWALDVAREFGITGAVFFTQPCAVNYIYYLVHHGTLQLPVTSTQVSIDGLPLLQLQDMPSLICVPGSYPAYFDLVLNQFSNVDKADFVLVNTFYKLETREAEAMDKVCPLLTIGPTIPSIYLDNRVETDDDYALSLLSARESSFCSNWLDSRPEGSVVYISFGSMADLNEEQMAEIAWGLTKSSFCFLWVVRESEKAKLPDGFIHKMDTQKGLVISWSHQLQVLSNKSIGCFFTHCGWNSTVEALSLGVPMVAMPQWTDQPTNAMYVEDVWKVGIRVKVDQERGIVKGQEIEFCLREVMEGEKGKELKMNAQKWRELAVEAVSEAGTSDQNINTLISKLLRS